MGCCLSGTLFSADENKNVYPQKRIQLNLEITHKENFLHFMNNHYSQFSDISMPMIHVELLWIIPGNKSLVKPGLYPGSSLVKKPGYPGS